MSGSEAESEAVFAEGRTLAGRAGDRHALARLVGFYGQIRVQLAGSALDYVRYGEEGAAIAAECDDPALRAAMLFERADELVESIGARSLSPRILELRGRLATALGDAPAAGQALRQALDLYRAIGATGHAQRLVEEMEDRPADTFLCVVKTPGIIHAC
jgi:hypothetical protein